MARTASRCVRRSDQTGEVSGRGTHRIEGEEVADGVALPVAIGSGGVADGSDGDGDGSGACRPSAGARVQGERRRGRAGAKAGGAGAAMGEQERVLSPALLQAACGDLSSPCIGIWVSNGEARMTGSARKSALAVEGLNEKMSTDTGVDSDSALPGLLSGGLLFQSISCA